MKSNKKSEKNIMKSPYMKYIIAAVVIVLIIGGIILLKNINKSDEEPNLGLTIGDENDDNDEYFDLDDEAKPSQEEESDKEKDEESNPGTNTEDKDKEDSEKEEEELKDGSEGRIF